MTTRAALAGRRVLLVEDQFIIALELEQELQRAGCIVTGPVARLRSAVELASRDDFDFAVLDVNLFGEKVFPVADILASRSIPFLLTTGYGESVVPSDRQGWRVVPKPYDAQKVVAMIVNEIG